jgi:tricorn protease-like protein
MNARNPERNFELLWRTFHNAYPFFELRKVDWNKQYKIYRPRVTRNTTSDELFDIFCAMLRPLNDGHVELEARIGRSRTTRYFTAEKKPRSPNQGMDAPLLQVCGLCLHAHPRAGTRQDANIGGCT